MSTGMYKLDPVVALPEHISLPKVMYALPKIQVGAVEQPKIVSEDFTEDLHRQKVHPEYNLLEARQMRILYQLSELRSQIEYLCTSVRLSDVNKTGSTDPKIESKQQPVNAEIILYASPLSPPYSILALQRLWNDTKFNVQFYKHSTLKNIQTTNTFEEMLFANVKSDTIHNINLKIIWKDVDDVQLVTRVHDYPFEGEANVLRYLTRLIENHKYEDVKQIANSILIDVVLNLALRLPYEESKNVDTIVSQFSNHLGKKPWLLNCTVPSIADVAVWSIIKRITSNKVPKDLKNWYDLCEKTFLA